MCTIENFKKNYSILIPIDFFSFVVLSCGKNISLKNTFDKIFQCSFYRKFNF